MSAAGLPPNLMALFQPRTGLEFLPPVKQKPGPRISACAHLANQFSTEPAPPVLPFETPNEKKARKKQERIEAHNREVIAKIDDYKPNSDEKSTDDPFATLFLSRINYGTTEKKLKKEFEVYGPIKNIRLVKDLEGKARGYGFVEFESDKDMKEAYKRSDGVKIDGRRLLVDVERGRVVSGWLPRRLGGGRGAPRYIPPKAGRAKGEAAAGGGGGGPEERREDQRPNRQNQDFGGGRDRRPDRRDQQQQPRDQNRDNRDKGDHRDNNRGDRHRDRDRRRSRSRNNKSRDRPPRSPRRPDRPERPERPERDSHRERR